MADYQLNDIRSALADLQRSVGRIEGQAVATGQSVTLLNTRHEAVAANLSKLQADFAFRNGRVSILGAISGGVVSAMMFIVVRIMSMNASTN